MTHSFPFTAPERDSRPSSACKRRWAPLVAYSLVLVLVSVAVTVAVTRSETSDSEATVTETGPEDSASRLPERLAPLHLAFGAQDTVADTVTIPAGEKEKASLLYFDVEVGGTPTSAPRAALVSFRVDCRFRGEPVEMQADGKVSTNVFVARGGQVAGQALTPATEVELECSLLASAPFIEVEGDELSALPVSADLRVDSTAEGHRLALRWLDDATLIEPGTTRNVLSLRVDDPGSLHQMSTTVRLTSCTVVGGSRDAGENQCQQWMTGRESSTVRMRVIARWLDADGDIVATTTYWDETLAVDYNTHHEPWNLRQSDMGSRVSDTAAVVLVVQVESLAGTPLVVHADGTDSVVTTGE